MAVGELAAPIWIAGLSESDVASVFNVPPADGGDRVILEAELAGDGGVGHSSPHGAAWGLEC